MKLSAAAQIGLECGLEYMGEAYDNITLHYSSLFIHEKAHDEIEELAREAWTLAMEANNMDTSFENSPEREDAYNDWLNTTTIKDFLDGKYRETKVEDKGADDRLTQGDDGSSSNQST